MAGVSKTQGYFLGVDSGNSKTVALIARADGLIVGWGRGGGGDIYVSEAEAVAAVAEAVEGALAAAGIGVSALTASCLSLVGADWPEDFDFWRLEAQKRGYGRAQVVNDALGALRAGTAGDGVAVVCGTGAAIGARRAEYGLAQLVLARTRWAARCSANGRCVRSTGRSLGSAPPPS